MPKPGWRTVSLPENLIKQIEETIKNVPIARKLYRNVPDFLVDSARRRIEELILLDRREREAKEPSES
ncbi:MAG: hypothetical protein ACTSP1_08225 [Candidatus Freyarchaeota archaeon]